MTSQMVSKEEKEKLQKLANVSVEISVKALEAHNIKDNSGNSTETFKVAVGQLASALLSHFLDGFNSRSQ